jgi:hypothetical protein
LRPPIKEVHMSKHSPMDSAQSWAIYMKKSN